MRAPSASGVQHRLHQMFELSIAAKAVLAGLETLTGLGLWVLKAQWVWDFAGWLTASELVRDPSDRIAGWMIRQAEHFGGPSQHFWAIYLMGHGAIKLAVVAALVAGVRWAYPLSIAVLAGFIAYQLHKYALTGSWVMLALTAFDTLVIWLIWNEWHHLPPEGARGAGG